MPVSELRARVQAVSPTAYGRRRYDKAKVWYAWVRDLGFAGFAYYLLHIGIGYIERHDATLSAQAAAMRSSLDANTAALASLATAVSGAQTSCAETRGVVLGGRTLPPARVLP
jgi:hypothetical protein